MAGTHSKLKGYSLRSTTRIMCLSARDRRRGRGAMLPRCLIASLFPKMDFHMPLCASPVVVAVKFVASGCATVAFESATASRADGPEGLLVPISGYRVPSLKLIATPHFRVLGQPTSWSARVCLGGANWLDPSLTPPLTPHGSASHHLNARLLLPPSKRQDWSASYLCRRPRLDYLMSLGQ